MLELQRTIGNRAVTAMLDRRRASAPGTNVFIQRIPQYGVFLTMAAAHSPLLTNDVFTTKAGEAALKIDVVTARAAGSVLAGQGNIEQAYQAYEQAPEEQKADRLINLYDVITFWETLNAVNRSTKWFEAATFMLGFLKEQIRREIRRKTKSEWPIEAPPPPRPKVPTKSLPPLPQAKGLPPQPQHPQKRKVDFGGHRSGLAPKTALPPPPARPAGSPGEMQAWMKEVGMSEQYFLRHLAGDENVGRRLALQEFYQHISQGHLRQAREAYGAIENVPGMNLIRPMILAHFTQQAGLANLVGTKSSGQGQVTKQEIEAIQQYSRGAYETMNLQLRSSGDPDIGAPDQVWSVMELVVSGMNKLPPFSGIAYRAFLTKPEHYFDVIQPGAMIVDLAFQSASPSLKGVEYFLAKGKGSKHIYCMIHAKSAVNIMEFASIKEEAEVLFRPGTKFRVIKVWQHINGRVPPRAPAEAQMILRTQGELKTEGRRDAEGKLVDLSYMTGIRKRDVEKDVRFKNWTPAEKAALKWHAVKVIEMEEV